MPIHEVDGGEEWGNHGKIYHGPDAKEKAEKQAAAAHANGFTGDEEEDEKTLDDLIEGHTDTERSDNIATEIRAGKPPKQAEAIAYSVQRHNNMDETGPSVVSIPGTLAGVNDKNRKFWEQK